MKWKNAALLMIFYLLCQKAGAIVVVTFSSQNAPGPSTRTHESCHENGKATPVFDTDQRTELHHQSKSIQNVESSAKLGQECCNFDCQCCFGCGQPLLDDSPRQTTREFICHPRNQILAAFPQAPTYTLFRPPITV
jgi:hypothetical protein